MSKVICNGTQDNDSNIEDANQFDEIWIHLQKTKERICDVEKFAMDAMESAGFAIKVLMHHGLVSIDQLNPKVKGGSSGIVDAEAINIIDQDTRAHFARERTAEMFLDEVATLVCDNCKYDKYWIGRDGLHGYENYCPCCGARFI